MRLLKFLIVVLAVMATASALAGIRQPDPVLSQGHQHP